jgi:hypothetical protein
MNPVPNRLWKEWIPANPNKLGAHKYTNLVKMPVTHTTVDAKRTFRYRKRAYYSGTGGSISFAKDTGRIEDRKSAVRQKLLKDPLFKDSHPFPMFKRYGYTTMDGFMNGWDWQFKFDRSAQLLKFNPVRHEYILIQPITDITTNELVLNFYPTTNKGKPVELLHETDRRFLVTV